MEPARVLHVLGSAGRSSTAIATIVSQITAGIDAERYSIDAWFTGGEGPLVAELEAAGAHAHVVHWHGMRRDPLRSVAFWRQLRRQRFAIAHFHVGGGSMVSLVRKATGAKTVVHLHGTASEEPGVRVPIHTARKASAVVAASHAVAAATGRQDVTVAYPGVAISPSPSSAASAGLIVGTAGRLASVKRVDRLLGAFVLVAERVPNARLEIAGDGPDRDALTRRAVELGIGDKVVFLGWTDDLSSAFRRWRAFAATSESEGLNLALAQAMGSGLPAVATNIGGMREVVDHEVSGYLVAPDEPSIAEPLIALLGDPDRAQRMGNAARQSIGERFSSEQLVATITSVYDGILR